MGSGTPGPGTDTKVKPRPKPKEEFKKPRLFKVLLHNDHYTTMDFVVMILRKVFNKSITEAVGIMLAVHESGIGIAGVYPASVAETKIDAVHSMARDHGFPLKCSMEPE